MTREFQRLAVLSHRAHDMIRRPVRYRGFHLDGHRHRCPYQTGEMRDDFIGNATGVAAHAGRVENRRAVKALRWCRRWLEASWLGYARRNGRWLGAFRRWGAGRATRRQAENLPRLGNSLSSFSGREFGPSTSFSITGTQLSER